MKNKSFTLIELLVVIVIIGILAGVIMISTSSSIDKASIARGRVFSSSVQSDLLSNLISEYTFDEEEGIYPTQIKDNWGNNNGTAYGNPQLLNSNCINGKCLKFDGDGDYIDLGNNNDLNVTKNMTISLWINLLNFGHNPYLISKRSDITQGYNIFMSGEKGINIIDGAGTTIYSDLSIENEKWKNIVFSIDSSGAKYRAYVDGVIGNEKNITTFSGNDINVYIGQRVNGAVSHYPKGTFDEVRIYNAALSSAQIKQNYIAGLDSLLSNGNISKEDYNNRINELAYE